VLQSITNLFRKKKEYKAIKSFTYYIPAPPDRKSGYQEKEFDQIFSHLMKNGFDIIDTKMQSASSNNASGVWVFCLLGAKTNEAAERDIEVDYTTISNGAEQIIKLDPSIEHD